MGFIVILPIAALAGWSIFAIFRWLRRANFGAKWWQAFGILGLAGLALGIWFGFFMHYQVAKVKLEGFPIPYGISNQESPDGPWRKGDMPPSVHVGAVVTDFLSGIALCLAPIAIAAFFKENAGKGPFTRPGAR